MQKKTDDGETHASGLGINRKHLVLRNKNESSDDLLGVKNPFGGAHVQRLHKSGERARATMEAARFVFNSFGMTG